MCETPSALLSTEGADLFALIRAADLARREDNGDDVSFVITRNINFTNVCYVGCTFCGFSRHKDEADAYDHPHETMLEKARDAVARGATEVCIQAGIHPNKDHTHYRDILLALKGRVSGPPHPRLLPRGDRFRTSQERDGSARLPEMAGRRRARNDAGYRRGDPRRRGAQDRLAPQAPKTARWVEIVKAAHSVGLRSSSTLMYGHIETVEQVAAHLALLREIQKETGGFTEFVPLGFIHERNILFNHMEARPGASMPEDLRMIAVGRLFLRPWITNIQMSWVKMGPKLAQLALLSGANDFGGTLMEESISRESGSQFGENLPPEEIRQLIRATGRTPVERSTTYRIWCAVSTIRAQDPPSLEPERAALALGPSSLATAGAAG